MIKINAVHSALSLIDRYLFPPQDKELKFIVPRRKFSGCISLANTILMR